MNCLKTTFSGHAIRRMFARQITKSQVLYALRHGEIIISYPDDQPYPSYLILWFNDMTPLHIVVSENKADNICYVITAYIPSSKLWGPDFKKRKTI